MDNVSFPAGADIHPIVVDGQRINLKTRHMSKSRPLSPQRKPAKTGE